MYTLYYIIILSTNKQNIFRFTSYNCGDIKSMITPKNEKKKKKLNEHQSFSTGGTIRQRRFRNVRSSSAVTHMSQ